MNGKYKMDKYICIICATIYDPNVGEAEDGIPPGTPFENLPPDWVCAVCGSSQEKFVILPPEKYEKLLHPL